MALSPDTVLFFDTNALRALGFEKEISVLLEASKNGEIRICLSELVVYERSRQLFERDGERLFLTTEALSKISNRSKIDILKAYHVYFKTLLRSHNVVIVEDTSTLQEQAAELVDNTALYFRETDKNDQRDALIFAAGLSILSPERSAILCQERRLGAAFSSRGFVVLDNAKSFFAENFHGRLSSRIKGPDLVTILEDESDASFSQSLHAALLAFDDTYQKEWLAAEEGPTPGGMDFQEAERILAKMTRRDDETRRLVLSRVHWFDPITKADLYDLLESNGVSEKQVNDAVSVLTDLGSIRELDSHIVPGADGLCEAIAASRIADLAELLSSQ